MNELIVVALVSYMTAVSNAFIVSNGMMSRMGYRYADIESMTLCRRLPSHIQLYLQYTKNSDSLATGTKTTIQKLKPYPAKYNQHETIALQDLIECDVHNDTANEHLMEEAHPIVAEFESYYKVQRILPETEFPSFIKSMKYPGPVDFRINPASQLSGVLQIVLGYISNGSSCSNQSLKQCRWHPGGLAWRLFRDRCDPDAWVMNLLVIFFEREPLNIFFEYETLNIEQNSRIHSTRLSSRIVVHLPDRSWYKSPLPSTAPRKALRHLTPPDGMAGEYAAGAVPRMRPRGPHPRPLCQAWPPPAHTAPDPTATAAGSAERRPAGSGPRALAP